MDPRSERLARNEVIFREVNEQVEALAKAFDSEDTVFEFFCECVDAECAIRLNVLLSAYQDVRSDSTLFIVALGHDDPEVEEVVQRLDDYQVVRKLGEAAFVAEQTDPPS